MLGKIADLVPYYHAASVFAFPSIARSEAFGIVQLEAMAAGKPVVNTQLDSGVPYVSLAGESGLTVPPGDPHALAVALGTLLDSPLLRAQYGRAARARVLREFTLSAMVKRTRALYEQILADSPSSGRDARGPARGPLPGESGEPSRAPQAERGGVARRL
jgi:rhamnosyl/mannosyltransferase